jgi:hypothetical protein
MNLGKSPITFGRQNQLSLDRSLNAFERHCFFFATKAPRTEKSAVMRNSRRGVFVSFLWNLCGLVAILQGRTVASDLATATIPP